MLGAKIERSRWINRFNGRRCINPVNILPMIPLMKDHAFIILDKWRHFTSHTHYGQGKVEEVMLTTFGMYWMKISVPWFQFPLRWRHNDHDGVPNHQPHGFLLNRLFRRRSKKTSKLRVTGLCEGNSPGPVNSPHKGPVTRKMFPFDDVIMADVFP